MKRWCLIVLLLLTLPIFRLASDVSAQESTLKSIVVFRDIPDAASRRTRIENLRGLWKKDLNLIHAAAADLTQTQIDELKKDPHVLRVDPDVQVFALDLRTYSICSWYPTWPGCKPTPTPTPKPTPMPKPTATPTTRVTPTPTPSTSQVVPWGISRISAPAAWATSTGNGVKVGVIDTGVSRMHPDLQGNIAGCVSFITGVPTCEDDNGHGSHVSGIIAAVNNTIGVVGVAPNAQIYALKVLDKSGSGYISDIISALNWSVTNGIQVVNMSLGTTVDVQSFHDAITAAENAGVIEVAAAGNSGPGANTVLYPGAYPEVIAVAATDSSDSVPSWSSRGPQVDIAAPGLNIYSTYKNGGYATLSGTSMATPHVTGAVALRLALHSKETFSQMLSVIQSTADHLPWGSNLVGAGLVNAQKVVAAP